MGRKRKKGPKHSPGRWRSDDFDDVFRMDAPPRPSLKLVPEAPALSGSYARATAIRPIFIGFNYDALVSFQYGAQIEAIRNAWRALTAAFADERR